MYLRSSGEWKIMDFQAKNDKQPYQIYPDDPLVNFTYVEYSIELMRIPTYFVFYLIMPCCLIACTTLLSFFLPAESGEKVSLGITVLLSLTVFLLLVAELLPPSGAVPIIGKGEPGGGTLLTCLICGKTKHNKFMGAFV